MPLEQSFLEFSIEKLESNLSGIESTVAMLSPEQVWARGGENQNAIGNLLLHLSGNVRQWIVGGVGGRAGQRERDAEFAARGNADPASMLRALRSTVEEAADVLRTLPAERLADELEVQGYRVTGLTAIYHVVEHFSGHAFQIFFIAKMLTGSDLGFYSHLSKGAAASEPIP